MCKNLNGQLGKAHACARSKTWATMSSPCQHELPVDGVPGPVPAVSGFFRSAFLRSALVALMLIYTVQRFSLYCWWVAGLPPGWLGFWWNWHLCLLVRMCARFCGAHAEAWNCSVIGCVPASTDTATRSRRAFTRVHCCPLCMRVDGVYVAPKCTES